jgi:hypothetical protein
MTKIMKKAQSGIEAALEARTAARNTKGPEFRPGQVKRMDRVFNANPERGVRVAKRMLKRANAKAEPMMKKGGKIIKKAQNGLGTGDGLRTGQYKRLGRIDEKNPARAERVADRMNTRATRVSRGKNVANPPIFRGNPEMNMKLSLDRDKLDRDKFNLDESNKKQFPKLMKQKSGGKTKMKAGGMLKRADGSYSKRGLWDNIRANKGSGKKPTAAMLKQEKKIKAKTK